ISGTLTRMRVWRARKEGKTYPGLINLLEAAPSPDLTAEEAEVFHEAYTEGLHHAQRLLAGTQSTDDTVDSGEDEAGDAWRSALPAPPKKKRRATLRDRVLALLGDSPMALADIVAELPDASERSISNALSELVREGEAVRP